VAYQVFWINACKTIKSELQNIIDQHPDAEEQYKVLCDIEDVAGYTPTSMGQHCQHGRGEPCKLL
jgi:hypothetical protein